MLLAYGVVRLLTGQPLLAVAVSAFVSLATFIVGRIIQFRGRLTLAITVIGLPLLVALVFASYRALDPFIKRQRSITALNDAGVVFYARSPEKLGEWKSDADGNMLPIWLADRIGPHCLDQLTWIDCDTATLQSIQLSEIDSSSLWSARLVRQVDGPSLTPKLIEWLNVVEPKSLQLVFKKFSDEDSTAISQLRVPYGVELDLNRDAGNLSSLTYAKWIRIHGLELTRVQSQQLSILTALIHPLSVEAKTISAEAIETLDQSIDPGTCALHIQGATLEQDAWGALSESRRSAITLDGVPLENLPKKNPKQNDDYVLPLLIVSGKIYSLDEIDQLARLFRCECIRADVIFNGEMPAFEKKHPNMIWRRVNPEDEFGKLHEFYFKRPSTGQN